MMLCLHVDESRHICARDQIQLQQVTLSR